MKRPVSAAEQQAQKRFGTSTRAASFYAKQMLDHLNPTMQQFIARQDMAFIATADANGSCDCSFRAGAPGFVQILDKKRSPTRNIVAMASWPLWATSWRTRRSA